MRTVNKTEKMRIDKLRRCIFGRVHTESEDASSKEFIHNPEMHLRIHQTFLKNKNKLNMINEI